MTISPHDLVLEAVANMVHDKFGGSYPALLQACLATNYFGDAWVVAQAMERARFGDLDERVRALTKDPEPWLVLASCSDTLRELERELSESKCENSILVQLRKLKRMVSKSLEKEVGK